MKKEGYRLANSIVTDTEQYEAGSLKKSEKEQYKKYILSEIRKEQKIQRKAPRWVAIAAGAAAVLLLTGTLFHNEVYAAIEHIRWNIGTALGLENDLTRYSDIVDTAVSDDGYIITLQEAVATEEKLVINYTVQRADGGEMDIMLNPEESLFINGNLVRGGVTGGAGYLDDTRTVLGFARSYFLEGKDLSGENSFELRIHKLTGGENETLARGKWNFAFTADGAELIADTKRLSIGTAYTLPNGVTVTLDEFTTNDLEQRVTYHASDAAALDYDLKLVAEDEQGRITQFYVKTFGGKECTGYMQNAEVLDQGRIAGDAGKVTVTLYAAPMPKENGKMDGEYVQAGEPAVWDLDTCRE